MDNEEFEKKCKDIIQKYYEEELKMLISKSDIYVVWSCKTLQNNKALLSTDIVDGRYFELTHNGDKKEIYVDAYKKEKNQAIKLEEKENEIND